MVAQRAATTAVEALQVAAGASGRKWLPARGDSEGGRTPPQEPPRLRCTDGRPRWDVQQRRAAWATLSERDARPRRSDGAVT